MRRSQDHLVRVLTAALTASPFLCGAARAETLAGIGVNAAAEYSSNPFFLNAKDVSAVRAQLTVSPFVEERMARSSLRVAGSATVSAYSRRYDESIDLSTQVDYRNTLTRQLSVRAGVALSSTVGSIYNLSNIFAPVVNPGVAPQIIDITVLGTQDRSTQASGSAGVTYVINDKNTLSLDYSGAVLRYPSANARSEYSTVQQNLSYSRTINSRTSAGASVGVTKINYFGGLLGDARIIAPSINGSTRVSSRWTVSGSIGVSLSRVDLGVIRLNSQNLSGSLNACRNDTRTTFCLNAGRSTSASAFDGLRTSTSIGANYSYRLSARDTFTASGGYSRSAAPSRLLSTVETIDYLSGNASWTRRLSDRMSGYVSAGFSQSAFQGTRRSVTASIGINYGFGNR